MWSFYDQTCGKKDCPQTITTTMTHDTIHDCTGSLPSMPHEPNLYSIWNSLQCGMTYVFYICSTTELQSKQNKIIYISNHKPHNNLVTMLYVTMINKNFNYMRLDTQCIQKAPRGLECTMSVYSQANFTKLDILYMYSSPITWLHSKTY